nr:hypothetical protein [Burkholderia stagnalis]
MSTIRNTADWFAVRRALSARGKWLLGIASFLLPLGVWCLISYAPFVWHPQVRITHPGSVDYFQAGMQVDRDVFADELAHARDAHTAVPEGVRANPVYLPAPHQVLRAFYTAFTTPPASRDGVWLHESLWHSIRIIFWGFVISSAIGVPLGIVCGTFSAIARLQEPFFEFFRSTRCASVSNA